MKVSIIGTGYVGLVSGACLADLGHHVVCVDVVKDKVDQINRGECPIFEEGLPELIARNVTAGRLSATTNLKEAIDNSQLSLIAAPTPFDGRYIDLKYIKQIAADIGDILRDKRGYHCVVIKSTVVPGTTDDVVRPLLETHSGKRAGESFGVGMKPEFLSERVAVRDFQKPDRLVFGGIDQRTRDMLARLYEPFKQTPRLETNNRTAEMIKYASNALQATLISFANEIAAVCSTHESLDAIEVMRGVHLMNEITPVTDSGERRTAPIAKFLSPGCGFGGSCFPKDVAAIVAHANDRGAKMTLLESVQSINKKQPLKLVDMAEQALGTLTGKRIAVLGLAFKAGTDDLRETPAIPIVKALAERGASVTAFDPQVHKIDAPATLAGSMEEAVRGADAVLLVTAWPQFAELPAVIAHQPSPPMLIDGRRFIKPDAVMAYRGIGLSKRNGESQ